MTRFLDICFLLVCAALTIAVGYGIGWVVYHWFLGVLAPMGAIGIHWGFGVLIVLAGLFFLGGFAGFIFMCLGFYGAVWLLGWAWYWSLLLYAPSFVISIFAGSLLLGGGLTVFFLQALNYALRRR